MPGKKSLSNDALSVIGSVRTGRMNPTQAQSRAADRVMEVEYRHFRWVMRGVQVFCLIFQLSFMSAVLDQSILGSMRIGALWMAGFAFSFIEIAAAGFLLAIYLLRFFGEWRTKRVLMVEGGSDLVLTLWQWTLFGVCVNGNVRSGYVCQPGISKSCDQYNWSLSFQFFTALAFLISLGTDAYASWRLHRVVNGLERLPDDQTEMEIRRQRMQH